MGKPLEMVNNQRGTALILALSMLVVLSLLGLTLMTNSNTESGISSNFHTARKAFYAADRAIEYVGGNSDIMSSTGTTDLYANVTHRNNILIDNSGLNPNGSSTATYLSTGQPPVFSKKGKGSDATVFEARYFVVEVRSAYPVNATNPSRAALEVQVARIVPK